jgi:hypothetical protein
MPDTDRSQDAKQKKHRCAICHTVASSVHKKWQKLRMDNGVVYVGVSGTLKLLLQPEPEPKHGAGSAESWEHNWLCGACRTRNVFLSQQARAAGENKEGAQLAAKDPETQQAAKSSVGDAPGVVEAGTRAAPAKRVRAETDASDSAGPSTSKRSRYVPCDDGAQTPPLETILLTRTRIGRW